MFKNLISITIKEFLRYKARYVFIIISMTIATIFTIFLMGSASQIEGVLLDMPENRSAKDKQLRVERLEGRLTQEDILAIMDKVNPRQVRVECKALVSKILLSANGVEYSNISICIFDGDYGFITENEMKNGLTSTDNIDYGLDGVYVSESFLNENNIDKNGFIENSRMEVDVFNDNNESVHMSIHIDGILPSGLVSAVNAKEKYDIYISNKVFGEDITTYPVGCILEFETFEKALRAYEVLGTDGYSLTKFDKNILDVKSEAVIYQTIFYIVTGVVAVTVISCIFFYMNINMEEHKVFWGILKSVGYRKMHLCFMCLMQSFVIGITGIFFGCIFTYFTGNFFVNVLIGSIMVNKDMDNYYIYTLDIKVLFIALFIILTSCVLGAIIPAMRITKKNSLYLLEDVSE